MKAALSAIGIILAASLLLATTGAQEAGTNASSSSNAVGRRTSLSERVRVLLAASGVEVGSAADLSASTGSHRELKVSWAADRAALPNPAAVQYRNAPGRVSLSRAPVRREGGLPKQRSAELAPEQVVVVAFDAEGRMRWCGLVADPRLLRAEAPGPDGVLAGQVIYRESAEFVISYPADESIKELRLYHPDWDGQKFSLALVGAVAAR